MARTDHKLELRRRRHNRVRRKVHGSAERPRLAVFRSNKHISAQLIDDDAGRTLAAASVTPASSSISWAEMCLLERNTARRGRSDEPCTRRRTRACRRRRSSSL